MPQSLTGGEWVNQFHFCNFLNKAIFEFLVNRPVYIFYHTSHIDGLVQDCSNSSALAMELLQSCTKPSILLFYTEKEVLHILMAWWYNNELCFDTITTETIIIFMYFLQ